MNLRVMRAEDYDAVYQLWQVTEGMGLGVSDTREAINRFLERNPGLSRVMEDASGRVIGAVLCGQDGRRGYLHHLAVAKAQRGHGYGRQLVETCLRDLRELGLEKCNIAVFSEHDEGLRFWSRMGWKTRGDLVVTQVTL